MKKSRYLERKAPRGQDGDERKPAAFSLPFFEAIFTLLFFAMRVTETEFPVTETEFPVTGTELLVSGAMYPLTETDTKTRDELCTRVSIGLDMYDIGYGCKSWNILLRETGRIGL